MLRDMQTDKRKVNLLTVTTPYPEENSLSGIPAGSVNWVETQILTPDIAALCTDVANACSSSRMMKDCSSTPGD